MLLMFLPLVLGLGVAVSGGAVAAILGGVMVLGFVLVEVVGLVALIRPTVLLDADDEGVRIGGRRSAARGRVPWSAIAGVRIYRFEASAFAPGMRMLGFVPTEPTDARWRGRLTRWHSRMTGTPLAISDRTLGLELEEVVALLRIYRPDLRLEYGPPAAVGLGRLSRPSLWRWRRPGGS
jgi:hypothetical protein